MTGDWRRLALAALAATAVACRLRHARRKRRRPAQEAAKKAPAKEADAEHAEDGRGRRQEAPKKKRQDPAEAQRAIDAALKLLEAGKSDQAAQALTTVLSGGNLPPAIMARALLYRGIAYRQQKKPAQAIADLTSALWLKGGLGEADRSDALKQRSSAYQEAGLGRRKRADRAGGAERCARDADGLRVRGRYCAQAPAAPRPVERRMGNPFAGWFGGSSSLPARQRRSQPPSTTASIPPRPGPRLAAGRPNPADGRSSTEVRGGPERGRAERRPGQARRPVPHSGRDGAHAGRGAGACGPGEARARRGAGERASPRSTRRRWATWARSTGCAIGPFASAQEGQAACAKLKGPGIDCLVVAQ